MFKVQSTPNIMVVKSISKRGKSNLPTQEQITKTYLKRKYRYVQSLTYKFMSRENYVITYPQSQAKYAEFNHEAFTAKDRILFYFGHYQK